MQLAGSNLTPPAAVRVEGWITDDPTGAPPLRQSLREHMDTEVTQEFDRTLATFNGYSA